jgi:hypothetical protein
MVTGMSLSRAEKKEMVWAVKKSTDRKTQGKSHLILIAPKKTDGDAKRQAGLLLRKDKQHAGARPSFYIAQRR